jgi:hypothetical protein
MAETDGKIWNDRIARLVELVGKEQFVELLSLSTFNFSFKSNTFDQMYPNSSYNS